MPDHSPRRIASLQPSATVILAEIGELDRVVACTKYCADVVPEITSRKCVILSDSWSANAEQILSAKPDLVIASVPYQEKAVIEILKSGVRFLGFAPKNLADIYTDIAIIAGAVDAVERGKETIEAMRQRIEDVRVRTAGIKRPTVFCEEWGKPLIASQSWVAELVEAAGGEFLGVPGRQISAEEVAQLDPDILIASWCGAGDRVPLEKIIADRNWQGTRAAIASHVYCIRDEYLNTPAPTLLHGLEALAFALHPAAFDCPQGIRQITTVSASSDAKLAL
ncbi:MAG: ABC transporter substrate-binding protein [Candidatus Sulfotelmatobacter sp.]